MKNKIIWVDLDEVLAELLEFVLEYNDYKIWSFEINRNDIKDYYIHRMEWLNITAEQAIEWFRKPMLEDIKTFKVKPILGSIDKLNQLKLYWYKLIIVTARIESIFWEYTKKWVDYYFPEIFEDIIYTDHFTDKHRDKWIVCKDLWIEYFIEDNYDYATDIAKAWIKTYLLEKPWNNWQKEYNKNIIRVKSWDEFMK